MQPKLTVIALALAVVATGVAVFALVENRSLRAELEERNVLTTSTAIDDDGTGSSASVLERLEAVEKNVARVEEVATNRIIPGLPGLEGREKPEAQAELAPNAADSAESVERVKELVDEAVEKKAKQFRAMANKKPSIDVFAETLELTDEQRAATEQEVLRGQRDIRSLLETPTEDGTIFLDELVEVIATGMAKPKEAQAGMMKLFGRLMNERVPGTNETYAARAEAVKQSVRRSFQRTWSEAQYERFKAWRMDPTEVQGIEGSPWQDLEGRIRERAGELGVELPESDGK